MNSEDIVSNGYCKDQMSAISGQIFKTLINFRLKRIHWKEYFVFPNYLVRLIKDILFQQRCLEMFIFQTRSEINKYFVKIPNII
jgi:anaerobic ribonucleoside-triphosphate reductase